MRGDLVSLCAQSIMDRPDAEMSKIELLNMDDDGFDGFRVELMDAPPTLSGKRKGQPNWRKATNRQARLISRAEFDQFKDRWRLETGLCTNCTGSGEVFASWHHENGTTYNSCRPCDGTGLDPERNPT